MSDYSHGSSRSVDPYLRKLRRRKLISGLVFTIVILAVIVTSSLAVSKLAVKRSRPKVSQNSLVSLWQQGDYQAVYAACKASLEIKPLDPFYLTFKGFSAFYLGLAESDGERRVARMDEAVFAIRKAMINEKAALRAESAYILGKAYFHKGADYYNEAIHYLEESLAMAYSRADTWEYLALAAQAAGLTDKSVSYFDTAIDAKPRSPELLLAAALANLEAGNRQKAEALAREAMSSTSDDYLAERCGFLLGDILRSTGRFEEALSRYEAIKAKNPQSADAWYYEGLVLQESGDPIKARASWRKAISIDPMHAGARQKLSERS